MQTPLIVLSPPMFSCAQNAPSVEASGCEAGRERCVCSPCTAHDHDQWRALLTFGPPQHETEALVLLLLQHHSLLVHHAVAVEEMPRRAPVSTAHQAQHGHGRPPGVKVHRWSGGAARAGLGQGDPTTTPPPPSPRTESGGWSNCIKRWDGRLPCLSATTSSKKTKTKTQTNPQTKLPPTPPPFPNAPSVAPGEKPVRTR